MFFNRNSEAKRISQREAKEIMDKRNVTLVDVRTPGEFAQGYIPGAMLLPLDRLAIDASKKLPDKDAEILIYCLSGNRSRTATSLLSRAGYTNIKDIGGIGTWPYGITR
ncbi:MAG: rhodanese-like domain-containing protein [Clostridia bacterium]|nr:rhodanese-like domain-containing protein [Clostridia bacterium]